MKIDNHTVAVITGAASGIGRALAVRLAEEGAQLAICDVNEAALQETAQLAADKALRPGAKISTHVVDVADRERVAAFVEEVVAKHGRAHLVINNAGVALAGTTEELAVEDIEWLMSINFWGVVYGTKMFLPILRQQPRAPGQRFFDLWHHRAAGPFGLCRQQIRRARFYRSIAA